MLDMREISIIYDEKSFVALYKPPGRETISQSGDNDVLSNTRDLLKDDGLQPVHRLDRDTSGMQLFSKNPAAERELTELFKHRQMKKIYIALCFGTPFNRSGSINRKLSDWQGGHKPVRVIKGRERGGLEAKTEYEVVASQEYPDIPGFDSISMIAFFPHHGRTHQIRVHAAALGYPIIADDQYGERPANKWAAGKFGIKRQALHSYRLSFTWQGENMELTSPLPQDMRQVVDQAFRKYELP